jgi:hypothetical protein
MDQVFVQLTHLAQNDTGGGVYNELTPSSWLPVARADLVWSETSLKEHFIPEGEK